MENKDSVTKKDILRINQWLDQTITQEEERLLFEHLAILPALRHIYYHYQCLFAINNQDPIVPYDFAQNTMQAIHECEGKDITILSNTSDKPNSQSA